MPATVTLFTENEILPQAEWSEFYWSVTHVVLANIHDEGPYHEGTSDGAQPWQTAVWVFETNKLPDLRSQLLNITNAYNQPITLLSSLYPEVIHKKPTTKELPPPEVYYKSRGA